MRVTTIDTLTQVTFMPGWFPINCYIVEEENDLTVVDTGMSFSTKAILQAAEKIGKPIRNIVVTHAHTDHIGGIDRLKEAQPDSTFYLPKRELELLEGDKSLRDGEDQTPIKGGVPKGIQARPDEVLVDGDRIGSLQAIHAPGHTPGMMAFIDVRTNALLAADAFQNHGGFAVAGDIRWRFPFPGLATWSKPTAIETARTLADYQPAILALGHGDLLMNPVPKMQEAINQAPQK
ncbi:MBL fold metallo-hydrolase [Halobacillus litoralis]|uniref:MBL fold metallo-hydrolase n=1 Tax=Halobacillus litoralis TaxID=45668 RepID=UPI001CD6360F|nr:MBL fold metallo-hydrolase [Halobacillus litoralis]MCA0972242.1 MBL fold metallo-hydrolase [Halobacillus litoralis]